MLVFVYGTLADPDRADAILGEWQYEDDAVLEGLHRVVGEYPTLAPGGSVEGRILRTPEVERLDAYEGVDRGLYVRVTVPEDDDQVHVYVGDPEALGAPVAWPGDGPFEDRVRGYLNDHDVEIRTTSPGH